jgi:DNA-binding CsgD family transcriptional regulator
MIITLDLREDIHTSLVVRISSRWTLCEYSHTAAVSRPSPLTRVASRACHLDATARDVRQLRRKADELAAAAATRTGRAAAELVAQGLSVRDVAALLGISPQRVS